MYPTQYMFHALLQNSQFGHHTKISAHTIFFRYYQNTKNTRIRKLENQKKSKCSARPCQYFLTTLRETTERSGLKLLSVQAVPLNILNKVCAHSRNNSSLHSNIYCRFLCNPTVTACCCRYPKPTIIVCAHSRDSLLPSVF